MTTDASGYKRLNRELFVFCKKPKIDIVYVL